MALQALISSHRTELILLSQKVAAVEAENQIIEGIQILARGGPDESQARRRQRSTVCGAGQAFGRRAPSILRPTRQAGQLPGDGVVVDCQPLRQPASGLPPVPTPGLA